MIINASYINTGILTIANSTGTLFSANISSKTVTIADFTVTGSSIYYGKTSLASAKPGVYIGTDGIALGAGTGTNSPF